MSKPHWMIVSYDWHEHQHGHMELICHVYLLVFNDVFISVDVSLSPDVVVLTRGIIILHGTDVIYLYFPR
ncbi:hypothetical protein MtrunA17_Chr5g0430561 [Medicago truncatula]|uniref:Uncharacterized protein n=1 Tax=Medicago truncatula TaxID=3880 RepID=A0A396HT64_MEDTR|nr:hypothetical protein MtrunA17_Chr5g0430561 [Medicago truncatula]